MYQRVVDAIKANEWETVDGIIDPKKVVLEYGNGNIAVEGDKLFWKGEEFHSSLSVRMIRMLQDGFDIKPMVAFMENLMLNPSKRAVTELYGFLEKNNLPITPMVRSWLTSVFVRTTRTCTQVLWTTQWVR
jgi:hypothetical protein